jgi:hypothetical protein
MLVSVKFVHVARCQKTESRENPEKMGIERLIMLRFRYSFKLLGKHYCGMNSGARAFVFA